MTHPIQPSTASERLVDTVRRIKLKVAHQEALLINSAYDAETLAAAYLNARLPVQVRVTQHESDPDWHRGRLVDEGRVGWVRTPVEGPFQAVGGFAGMHAYIEDMSAGDDGCPSRYHNARHLVPVDGEG